MRNSGITLILEFYRICRGSLLESFKMNKSILLGLVCLGVTGLCLQAQEAGQNEFSVSALGSFQRSSSGNGINQSANGTAGVLFSYRYFFNAHHGLEMDYG